MSKHDILLKKNMCFLMFFVENLSKLEFLVESHSN